MTFFLGLGVQNELLGTLVVSLFFPEASIYNELRLWTTDTLPVDLNTSR